jgi:hypothetical protein
MPCPNFQSIVFVLALLAFVMAAIVIAFTIPMLSPVLLVSFANPVLSDKVHRSTTGIVLATVLFPVLLWPGGT